MTIIINWKGNRIGSDIRKVNRIKLTNKKLYLWDETQHEILVSHINGFETIKELQ